MNKSRKATKSDKILNLIMVVVIAIFVAIGAYAAYGKISAGIEEQAIVNGEKEATVEYLANQSNMTVEDYLAQYGLTLGGEITKKTTQSEMENNMTIENYLSYSGSEKTADEVLEETGLGSTMTKDTIWKDFMDQVPAWYVMGSEESFNQIKEQYELGDEVTANMPYGEFEEIINAKIAELSAASEETETTEDSGEYEVSVEDVTEDAAGDNAAEEGSAAE